MSLRIKSLFWIVFISNTLLSTGITSYLIEWDKINIYVGLGYLFIYFCSVFNTSEILLKSLIFLFHKKKEFKFKDNIKNKSVIINYNLKSFDKNSIDECFKNYYNSFINNISQEYIGVLISATNDDELQKYEIEIYEKYKLDIYNLLVERAKRFLRYNYFNNHDFLINIDKIDQEFNCFFWKQFDQQYLRKNYLKICKDKSDQFLYLKRKCNILKKCGQYQDLITLSQGYLYGYTYQDKQYYGDLSRERNEFLFDINSDIINQIYNKEHKYTLVLDSDSKIGIGEVYKMVNIAEQYLDFSIIQPQIKFYNQNNLFQHVQTITQYNSNILNSYFSSYINHASFFGKGLINNKNYFDRCIGRPENTVEFVPLNCISHDTFESMVLPTLYCDKITIFEETPKSLISWNIRELRWNYGDILVAKHIYPNLFCRTKPTYCKNRFKLNFSQLYFALAPVRILISKPLLLLFIGISIVVPMKYSYIPFIYIIIIIIILPSLINLKISNFKNTFIVLTSMIFHFTPDSLLGSIRLLRIIYKLITNNNIWISQQKIENDIQKRGIIRMSIKHFGVYTIISSILFGFVYNKFPSLNFFLLCIMILPVYCIIIDSIPYQKLPRLELKNIRTNYIFNKKSLLPLQFINQSQKVKGFRSVFRENRISKIFTKWFY